MVKTFDINMLPIQTYRRNARTSVSDAGDLRDDDLFTRSHTTLHVTDGDDGLRIFFRFTSLINPVRNNYYFADTETEAYSILFNARNIILIFLKSSSFFPNTIFFKKNFLLYALPGAYC